MSNGRWISSLASEPDSRCSSESPSPRSSQPASSSAPAAAQGVPAPTVTLRHEIVQGTVTAIPVPATPDAVAKPLAGVDVIVTRGPDRAYKSSKTDATGHYVIDWPDGTGDYLVHVAAAGYETFRKRVTRAERRHRFRRRRSAPKPAVQQLAPVVTTARKPKPDRNPTFGADVGASEQLSGGLVGKLPPDVAGDLAAIAGTMPGVTPTAGGISVLGLGPDQNSTTLNGMAFAGSDIPRDANTRVRVSASAYDPSRGWFSGANTNVELAPGNLFGGRRSHLTLDAPTLQYTDPVSARLGQRFIGGNLSLGADGELIEDKWYYNVGLQGGRRSAGHHVARVRRRRSATTRGRCARLGVEIPLASPCSRHSLDDRRSAHRRGDRQRRRSLVASTTRHSIRQRSAPRRPRGDSRRTANCRAAARCRRRQPRRRATAGRAGKTSARCRRSTRRSLAATTSPMRARASRSRETRPTRICRCRTGAFVSSPTSPISVRPLLRCNSAATAVSPAIRSNGRGRRRATYSFTPRARRATASS